MVKYPMACHQHADVAGPGRAPRKLHPCVGERVDVQNTRVLGRQRRRFKVQMGAASGFTTDVSAGGFCAELMRVFPKGTAVKGTLLVEGRDFEFSGRVAWAKQGDFRLNMRGRMGVAFTDAPEELRRIFGVSPSGTPLPAPGPLQRP
jgi:hypothetical protein